MSKTLTDASVEKLKPDPDKRREIADANVTGLYLIIHSTGRKVWALRTRRPGGKTAKVTLGPVDQTRRGDDEPVLGSPMGLRAARVLATQLLHQRAKGVDVADQSARKRGDGDSFAIVAREFIEDHARPRNRTWRTAAKILGLCYKDGDEPTLIAGGLAQRWGSRPIASVNSDAIHEVIAEATRRAIPGIAPKTAGASNDRGRTTAKILSKMFSWCVQHRRIKINPVTGLHKPPAGASRDRVLSDAEIKRLWSACDQIGHPFGGVIQLLVLSGQRLNEISDMRWSELSDDLSTLTLPASRTKNKRVHVVWLSPIAQRIISGVPRMADSDFVFTVTGHSSVSGFSKAKERIDRLMGKAEEWRLHDIRRSAISGMAALGIGPHILEAVANHQGGFRASVAGVYNRYSYSAEKRAALELWADKVAQIVAKRAD